MNVTTPAAWVAIAVGAVLGAWARWVLGLALNRPGQALPWGTLAVNVAGGLLVGMALAWFERHPEAEAVWRPLLVTGFLGALTTFSTFSGESIALIQRGAWGAALLHSAAHLAGAIGATALGWRLLR